MTNKRYFSTKDFIRNLADKLQCSQKEAERIYNGVGEVLEDALKTGEVVSVGNVCRLQFSIRKSGTFRNPKTGETVFSEAKPKITCTVTNGQEDGMKTWPIYATLAKNEAK